LRRHQQAVVVAPPGSGKTTRVPGAILDAGLAGQGQVLVLQPRRVAARLAARRVAWERGVQVGQEVGYQLRFERRVGRRTRIAFLTEGLLLRRLQADPFLEGVGCVVLDELHERSLQLDLALALLRELRQAGREELLLVAMSATLDPGPVVEFLGGEDRCAVLRAEGRVFPVQIDYLEQPRGEPLPVVVARAVRRLLRQEPEGHLLVFLPGVPEIRRCTQALGRLEGGAVLPLHGSLRGEEQDRALAPSTDRKVVLATNIAQTSVTLEGVRAVVDSGLVKQPRLDPALGLERLQLVRIAQDAADQRAGRAGRTGPGRCLRLWTRPEQSLLAAFTEPELCRADLCSTLLELRAWGADPRSFGWLEAPPEASLAAAEATLAMLGALDAGGQLTALGRQLQALGVHPRLARVVVEGHAAGQLGEAAALAALASERDPLREVDPAVVGSDLDLRLRLLDGQGSLPPNVDRGALRLVQRLHGLLQREALRVLGPAPPATGPSGEAQRAAWLLAGFPDRVAQQRKPGSERYVAVGRRGLVLDAGSAVGDAALILAVGLRAARRTERAEHRVTMAVPLEPGWLELQHEAVLRFHPEREAVEARRITRYRDLVLEDHPSGQPPDPDEVRQILQREAQVRPQRALRLEGEARLLVDRVRFLAHHLPELGWPDLSDLSALLPRLCWGRRSFAQLGALDWLAELKGLLEHRQLHALEQQAPERFTLPTGSSVKLRYPDTGGLRERAWAEGPEPPVLAARIQQLFGLRSTPRLARGRAGLLVHLLAPNNRPAQVTSDLESFWGSTYQQVRKELRGRYPRHAWPEDPLSAEPQDRPRRR